MKLGKRHAKGSEEWGTGQKLLVAIIHVPNGQYFKEVSSDMALRDVKASPYSATFMEVSKKTLDALKAHPRSNEIFD